ncbi:MAG: TetR family transcriptional regulator C-terminal domain-containing protein [Gammaproteobacteria bacterium]|nr:TetR family transcriptional regulator C-terminal domain-containing protein [Gammaproteobacteria bacterium]
MSTAGCVSCAHAVAKRSDAATSPKFRREPPEARRAELIAATLACLERFGHAGVSVRRISAAAGVTMGLINHHFAGIDALVAAAYEALAMRLLARSREAALALDAAPADCLHAFFAASFTPEALDPALFRVWVVFWSLVPHSAPMRAVHDRTYAASRATLETLLSRLKRAPGVPAFRIGAAAIALAALMDGLWVELSLNPASFAPGEAVGSCDDWVQGLAAGAFPGLRNGSRGTARTRLASQAARGR